jgi:hypothetical protein
MLDESYKPLHLVKGGVGFGKIFIEGDVGNRDKESHDLIVTRLPSREHGNSLHAYFYRDGLNPWQALVRFAPWKEERTLEIFFQGTPAVGKCE